MRVCPVCRAQFPAGSNFCPHDGHRLEDLDVDAPAHDPLVGIVLDKRYKVESKLGSGGMGDVYAARHVVIDKPVAVKILRAEYSRDPRQAERFIREARAASHIGHPNIVDVTDFGRLDNNQIYFVMEFLIGVTLGKELKSQGALTTRRTLNLGIQICHALEAAHAKGIVHRDLKPENIFIVNPITRASDDVGRRQQDIIKLLDFGIAKITWDAQGRRLTKVGSIFGTPQYMSPEQAAGNETDHRGDVYSLGCIVYEMLTGEVPFIADTFMGTLTKQMFENPIPPRQLRPDLGIPEPLETLILRAMSKDPDERFQSMKEMAVALEACFQVSEAGPIQRATDAHVVVGEPSEVVVVQPDLSIEALTGEARQTVHLLVQPRRPRRGRQPLGLILGAVGLFVLLTGTGLYLVLSRARSRASSPVAPDAAPALAGPREVTAPDAGNGPPPARAGQDAAMTRGPTGEQRSAVRLVLRSVPDGATVRQGARTIGRTPTTVEVARDERQRFVFSLRGFRQQSLEQRFGRDGTHTVRLQPLRRTPGTDGGTVRTPYGSVEDLRNPFHGLKGKKTGK